MALSCWLGSRAAVGRRRSRALGEWLVLGFVALLPSLLLSRLLPPTCLLLLLLRLRRSLGCLCACISDEEVERGGGGVVLDAMARSGCGEGSMVLCCRAALSMSRVVWCEVVGVRNDRVSEKGSARCGFTSQLRSWILSKKASTIRQPQPQRPTCSNDIGASSMVQYHSPQSIMVF